MRSKWLISMGLVVCLLMAFALPMCAPAPPAEEEEAPPVVEEELAKSIRAYMSSTPEHVADQANFIKQKLGVEVRYLYMSCGVIGARLEAEAPRFSADMCISVCGPQAVTAKKEGWSIAYDSPVWRGLGSEWKDPDDYWFNTACVVFVLVGNEDRLAEQGYAMPDSWEDLLDPKWKDQIVMPSPGTSGTAFRMLFTFLQLYGTNVGKGEEGGWEYLAALDKNIDHYTSGGNAPTDLVARGEFTLGITNQAKVQGRIDEGYPLLWTIPEEGSGFGLGPNFILKGAEELYTCQKIIDLLGTKEFSALRAATGYVVKDDVPIALFGTKPKLVPNLDLNWAFENQDRLMDEWKTRFVTK